MKYISETLIALAQLSIMVLLYPLLLSIVLMWKSDKYGFHCLRRLCRLCGCSIYLYPAFGKWFMPIVTL